MKRLILTTIVALFAMVAAQAQTAPEVVVRLKSGNEVRGMLIERDAEGIVTIRTAEGDTFVYGKMDYSRIREVEDPQAKAQLKEELDQLKLAEKESAKQLSIQAKDERREMLEERALGKFRGYRGIVEVVGTPLTLTDSWIDYVLSASMINGYSFGSLFYAGIGVGLSLADGYSVSIPIYLHLRSAFLKNMRVSPYVSFNVGYAIGADTALLCGILESGSDKTCSSGGFYIEPTLGAEIRLTNKKAITIGLTMPLIPEWVGIGAGTGKYYDEEEYRKLLSIGLKIGFSF